MTEIMKQMIINNDRKAFMVMLRDAQNVNQKDSRMNSLLHMCCDSGRPEIAEFLLLKGARMNDENMKGFTPLMTCIQSNQLAIMKMLIDFGADLNAISQKGNRTALLHAVQLRRIEMVRLLLEAEADPNIVQFDGKSALHIAIQLMSIQIVDLLLLHRANILLKDNQNMYPYDISVTLFTLYAFGDTPNDLLFECTEIYNLMLHYSLRFIKAGIMSDDKSYIIPVLDDVSTEEYHDQVQDEITTMKQTRIDGIPLFHILVNKADLTVAKNRNVSNFLLLPNCPLKRQIPKYFNIMLVNFRKVQRKQQIIDFLVPRMQDVFNQDIPNIPTEEILSFLSIHDLRKLVNVVQTDPATTATYP